MFEITNHTARYLLKTNLKATGRSVPLSDASEYLSFGTGIWYLNSVLLPHGTTQ